jgi:hypothetical protein
MKKNIVSGTILDARKVEDVLHVVLTNGSKTEISLSKEFMKLFEDLYFKNGNDIHIEIYEKNNNE